MINKWTILVLALAGWLAAGGLLFEASGSQAPELAEPGRIISCTPNLTEVLFALGLGEKVVAVSQFSSYPPAAAGLAKIGSFWEPDFEAIIAQEPDLVLTLSFPQQKELAERLRRAEINARSVTIWKVDDLFDAIEEIGEYAGVNERGRALAKRIKDDVAKIQSQVKSDNDKARVLWVVQREPLRVAGTDVFETELVNLAGGRNAMGATIHKYPLVSAEQLYAVRPEVIIEAAMAGGDIDEHQRGAHEYWRKYESLPAVRDGRIYSLDGDLVSRLGPRLAEAVAAVADCICPGVEEAPR